jgi:hypothetical protein
MPEVVAAAEPEVRPEEPAQTQPGIAENSPPNSSGDGKNENRLSEADTSDDGGSDEASENMALDSTEDQPALTGEGGGDGDANSHGEGGGHGDADIPGNGGGDGDSNSLGDGGDDGHLRTLFDMVSRKFGESARCAAASLGLARKSMKSVFEAGGLLDKAYDILKDQANGASG